MNPCEYVTKKCKFCPEIMTRGANAKYCSVDCALLDQINKKTEKECWEWLGTNYKKSGYGRLKFDGKTYKPYRLMCEKKHGELGEMCAMHICDNRICCNPDHLIPGTHADNIKDMDKKGRRRNAVGSAHGQSKFTEEDIIKIRNKKKTGVFAKDLAKEYKCSINHIYLICNKKIWKHI